MFSSLNSRLRSSAGDYAPPPTKRRKIDPKPGPSSFRSTVNGIVERKKAAAGGVVGTSDGGAQGQKKLDDYFGWKTDEGLDDEIARIVEGVMGQGLGGTGAEGGPGDGDWGGHGGKVSVESEGAGQDEGSSKSKMGDGDSDMKDVKRRRDILLAEDVMGLGTVSGKRRRRWRKNNNGEGRGGEGVLSRRIATPEPTLDEPPGQDVTDSPRQSPPPHPAPSPRQQQEEEAQHHSPTHPTPPIARVSPAIPIPIPIPIPTPTPTPRPSSSRAKSKSNRPSNPSAVIYPITPATSDVYTTLLNTTIQSYLSHTVYDSTDLQPSYILGSYWAVAEKQRFFDYLASRGRHDLPGIASGVGTKSLVEVRAYLKALEEGWRDARSLMRVAKLDEGSSEGPEGEKESTGDEEEDGEDGEGWLLNYEDIPAAVELSDEIVSLLDQHAKYLDDITVDEEVAYEKEKHGEDGWRIEFEKAVGIGDHWKKVYPYRARKAVDPDPTDPSMPHVSLLAQETELLRIERLLELSKVCFMQPPPFGHEKAKPAIRSTCLQDLHSLVVSLTQKLVHASMFIARTRLQSNIYEKTEMIVRIGDVKCAVGVLGLEEDAREWWVRWAGRAGVRITEKRDRKKAMSLEEVDGALREWAGRKKIARRSEGPKEEKIEQDEEMEMAVGGGGDAHGDGVEVDEDGDQEMGDAPAPAPPPLSPPSPTAASTNLHSGFNSFDDPSPSSPLPPHSTSTNEDRSKMIHEIANTHDLLCSAEEELALWKALLPGEESYPAPALAVVEKLENMIAREEKDGNGGDISISGYASSVSESDSDTDSNEIETDIAPNSSGTTTPIPIPAYPDAPSPFRREKTSSGKRKASRKLGVSGSMGMEEDDYADDEDDDQDDWAEHYPYYAAWVGRIKKPGSAANWSGDDSESGNAGDMMDTTEDCPFKKPKKEKLLCKKEKVITTTTTTTTTTPTLVTSKRARKHVQRFEGLVKTGDALAGILDDHEEDLQANAAESETDGWDSGEDNGGDDDDEEYDGDEEKGEGGGESRLKEMKD